ncbi:MAG: transketolase [Patescibacteria group bacterium]
MATEQILKLKEKANWVRQRVLEMITTAGKGHIGGAFSCTDILTALYYGGILRFQAADPKWIDRDRFILSKGHSAAALYVILSDLGYFPSSELSRFQKENCILGAHPSLKIPGIEADTGSLGHGLGIGVGLALSAKLGKKDFMTFVLLGDGECCEGSIWEAAMFASGRKLNNLVGIVDKNSLCSTDFLENCVNMEQLEQRWKTFGWDAVTVDGHSLEELVAVLSQTRSRQSEKPLMIIANTVKSKGVSFMEGKPEWHHSVPNKEQFEIAKKELSEE